MKDIILGMLNDAVKEGIYGTKAYDALVENACALLDSLYNSDKKQYLDIIEDIVAFDYEKRKKLSELNYGFFKHELKEESKYAMLRSVSYTFENGVTVVNTTPHPLRFEDSITKEVITILSNKDILINAKAVETNVRQHFIKTVFEPNDDGFEKIKMIKYYLGDNVVIIGSMIAAQAYKGQVFGMTPVVGYERVAPDEKLMRDDKFVTYE